MNIAYIIAKSYHDYIPQMGRYTFWQMQNLLCMRKIIYIILPPEGISLSNSEIYWLISSDIFLCSCFHEDVFRCVEME